MTTILDSLNDSQRQAVQYCDGPELVIAGAGSGKTRVLTYKIAWLLQGGYMPWNILALTFTNKAAGEMKERVGHLVGTTLAKRLFMGTFHSVFSHILRVEAEHVGFRPQFTIYDETDSRSLLKSIVKDMKLDDKTYRPGTLHSRISMAKNQLVMPDDYERDTDNLQADKRAGIPEAHTIYHEYQQRLRGANAMDFDDLLVFTYQLFRDHEDIRRKYAERFHYVLVDEYQDTNYVQQQIIALLTKEQRHVCVVGDDYQSIYAFRGARIDNILNFQQIYPEVKLFKLERNYRSTQSIVAAANSLMKHNRRQIPKEVYSKNDIGDLVQVREAASDREEAAIVCKEIRRIKREEHCSYSDFAILYRTNAQSRSFEEEMNRSASVAIPYRIIGGLSFYQRKEIKDILAYFRVVVNPADEEAMKRIINYPARGIGATTVQRIAFAAHEQGASFWDVICRPSQYGLNVNQGTMTKLSRFQTMIDGYMAHVADMDAYELGRQIVKTSGIEADLYADKSVEGIARTENLDEFMNGLSSFVDEQRETGLEQAVYLTDYLQSVALLTDLDSVDSSEDKVSLMTIHAAKGLEFNTVFVVGMEDNLFPGTLSSATQNGIEEERRLLYVAITRAQKHCFLTWAKSRWRYGKMEFCTPSRFLRDIDDAYMNKEEQAVDDFEPDRPYVGSFRFERDSPRYGRRVQNSRPVASQFMADVKPKVTSPRRREPAVNPLSDDFQRQLAARGANMRKVSAAVSSGGRQSSYMAGQPLEAGNIIEHQRFGVGTVVKVEGTGENAKATVEFRNSGTKQLLLKFAKYTVIK